MRDFLALNPNAKVPVIVDGDVTVFDSNAILLYLAEKTGRFLPVDAASRGPLLSWLICVATGIGPYAGQAVHFRHFAPEPVPMPASAIASRHGAISSCWTIASPTGASCSARPTPSST